MVITVVMTPFGVRSLPVSCFLFCFSQVCSQLMLERSNLMMPPFRLN